LFEHDPVRKPVSTFGIMLQAAPADATQHALTIVVVTDPGAVTMAAIVVNTTVVMMAVIVVAMMVTVGAAVLVRRDDGGHRAEDADHGSGGRGVVVAVIVSAAGARRDGNGSQCNRGRSSNSDCAAGHNTHFGFLAHVVPSLGINVDLIKIDRRDNGAANYVFAM
jgi:hypothetical protein